MPSNAHAGRVSPQRLAEFQPLFHDGPGGRTARPMLSDPFSELRITRWDPSGDVNDWKAAVARAEPPPADRGEPGAGVIEFRALLKRFGTKPVLNGVNIYDLVNHQKVVLTPKTVEELIGILKPRAKDDEEAYRSREDGEETGGPARRVPESRGAAV